MYNKEMHVIKRNNRGTELVKFDKITERIKHLCKTLPYVDPSLVALQTIKNIHSGISTEKLDLISAEIAESYKTIHPEYGYLATKLLISNLHKVTLKSFSECMKNINEKLEVFSEKHLKFILANKDILDDMIINENDYLFDYVGFKTMEKLFLIKADDVVIDRPQYVFMRVAISISFESKDPISIAGVFENIKQRYKLMSQMYFTHATPTLFNACMKRQQLNSCFLLGVGDSVEDIKWTDRNSAIISKGAGGIAIHMSDIRCTNQKIKSTNGKSAGLVRILKGFNETACTYNQGGRRNGAFAIYIEPWHGDILAFLRLKLNQGHHKERAHDLFYGLWVPDLFVNRARDNLKLSLFSSDTAPGLSDVYDGMDVCKKCGYYIGQQETICFDHEFEKRQMFTELYTKYENEGRAVGVVSANDVVDAICELQRDAGSPYICFKDHVNRMSMQKSIGVIKSSNLCTEIMEHSTKDSYACCTLASISLKQFIVDGAFDYDKLHEVTMIIANNLDIIIDINDYPVIECENNSHWYRPIAIGVQGLADVFIEMRLPFLSEAAAQIDLAIFETIYHAALSASCERAKSHGAYKTFNNSPAAKGILAFDLWLENQQRIGRPLVNLFSSRYTWDILKADIMKHGLRNSLLVACMPTVSTSQIFSNNESFEPIPACIYTKNTIAGKFTMVNAHMLKHFIKLGIWNEDLKKAIINNNGSVQGIENVPPEVQRLYLTVWEMKQTQIMQRANIRGAFVDQSQSLNIYLANNTNEALRGVFFYGHELGLKTGSYYIRTKPAVSALKNNISETNTINSINMNETCTTDNIGCTTCAL